MPIRKRHLIMRPDVTSPSKLALSGSPVAVFYYPQAHCPKDEDVFDKKIVSRPVSADKIAQAVKRGGKRVGLVITDAAQMGNSDFSHEVAKTLFLLDAELGGVNVAVTMSSEFANLSSVRPVVDALSTPILFSDLESLSARSMNTGSFERDSKSITGLFYTGKVSEPIANYSAILSLAVSVVSCCYAGRGAPAGTNWLESVLRIAEDFDGLKIMVKAASLDLVSMDELEKPDTELSWRGNLIREHVIRSDFVRSNEPGKFRDSFYSRILPGGDPELEKVAKNMKIVEGLWAKVPNVFDGDIFIEDVNPDSEHVVARLKDLGNLIGVGSFIEAYLIGVPLEDLFA